MKGKSSLLSSNQFQFASSIIQKQSLSSLNLFVGVVEKLLGVFQGEKVKLLFEMKSSRRFVERMSLDIRGKEDGASKLRMNGVEMEQKRDKYAGKFFFFFFLFFVLLLLFYICCLLFICFLLFINVCSKPPESITQQKPILAKAIKEIKDLQTNLEKDVGGLISHKVNIIGDLNDL